MKISPQRPDPARLLEAFVASNRCEKTFAKLVESLNGLVYTSALRRTGNAQLAEEVAQNVFAIMARKADSLRRHPSLTAWALKTTRLQSANAVRSERRRQRKIAALTGEATARHSPSSNAMDDPSTWKDAVPFLDEALDRLPDQDQKLILQRFYEEKKFKEIASQNGQTEAACKKRVQRALQKLGSLLTSRGVTLTGTAVASLLGAELARAAPAHTAAVLAPKALAASSSIPASTLLANTFQTMSKLKTTTMTAATIVAVAAIPFSQQRVEANRIQAELQTVTSQQSALQEGAAKSVRTRADGDRTTEGRTAGSLLASLDGPVEHRAFIRHMLVVAGTPDPLAQSAVASRLQRMSLEERRNLIRALKDFPMAKATKSSLAKLILDRAPEMSPREKMEELIVWGRSTSQSYMSDWAADDPDAAMQWFWEKRASGELDRGLGPLNRNLYESTLSDLLRGVARNSPAKVLDFYRELPKGEIQEHQLRLIAGTIARGEIERGEQTSFREMLETHSGNDRKAILVGVLSAHAGKGLFDEGMAIVDDYVQSPAERDEYLKSIFETTGLPFWRIGTGLDWLVASTPEDEAPAVMRRVIQTATFTSQHKTLEWVEGRHPGAVRDHAYAGWVEQMLASAFADDFPRVLPAADKIEDPALRTEIRRLIRTKWDEQDQEKISPYIPAAVLEKLENL